jgi:hypothetical protein
MGRSRESVARIVTAVGLHALAALSAYMLIVGARDPHRYDGYRFRREAGPIAWDYPTYEVANWIAALIFQAVGASLFVLRTRGSAGRVCFLLALIAACATFAFGVMLMHAPLPFGTQFMFTLFATGWLVACSAVGALAARADKDDEDCAV